MLEELWDNSKDEAKLKEIDKDLRDGYYVPLAMTESEFSKKSMDDQLFKSI